MYNITGDIEVNLCKKFKVFHDQIFNGDWITHVSVCTNDHEHSTRTSNSYK